MATEAQKRCRRLNALLCAAAYADNRGGILAANDSFTGSGARVAPAMVRSKDACCSRSLAATIARMSMTS
jgi:hypothetical protein